jgi:septal ring factor EnvC (AmiA/AmiB activator)
LLRLFAACSCVGSQRPWFANTLTAFFSADPAVTAVGSGLIKEKEQLEGDVAMMRDRMAKMQEQTTQFMRERTALNDQIAALKDELAAKNKALEASQNGQSAMLGKLQQDFAALSTEAAGACVVDGIPSCVSQVDAWQ